MKRTILATALLSGLIAAQAASAAPVTVVEYYNRTLNTYFITGRTAEQQMLDQVADFARTGMSFQARSTDDVQPASVGICRFYVSIASPFTNSHFYGRQQVDCEPMAEAAYAGFSWEGYDFRVPGSEGDGTCPEGATPVYRSFRLGSDGVTSNHRFTVSTATYNAAASAGYRGEGQVFCASGVTDAR